MRRPPKDSMTLDFQLPNCETGNALVKPPLVWFAFRAAVTTESAPSSLRAQEVVPASTQVPSFTPAVGRFPQSSLLNTSVFRIP